jgi:predicted PurR-regulated permease PerM
MAGLPGLGSAALLWSSRAWAKGLFLTAWGVLVGSIDNFLSPRLVGKRAASTSC